jgi:hypothetical protein
LARLAVEPEPVEPVDREQVEQRDEPIRNVDETPGDRRV